MMKISKPVLTNDFTLSSVQFTSLNSIVFKNINNVYDGNEKISLEYEHSSKIEASSRDWIGIFPRGWSTLQQYITFEWVCQSLPSGNNEQNKENAELVRRMITFCPKHHVNSINSNTFYQFVYVSKQIEVLGVSSYFRFDTSSSNDTNLELECLVPASSKLRSTSVSDFGIFLPNNISSSTSIDARTLQTASIHSLQNLDPDGKNWAKPPLNLADIKKPSIFQRKATAGDILNPYSSHSEPVFPMSFQTAHCKKCFHFKRGGEFLRSQQVLQSKVGPQFEEASEFNGQRRTLGRELLSEDKLKIVMERNKVLEERAIEMKKEMERLQAESKKLKMSYYNTNKEKVAYEKFVKDFIKSLEKDSIVRVVNGNTEILVKKVNYVGMEEHPRDKKTSKRERELKAVIGLQEITIRNLINSLQEKAKSVQELNQTVKLAQAFSAARDNAGECNSDAEEGDETSSSDVTSEYEFSLTKPQLPEDSTVDDTDAVLDDIRRATEMELKDIGISRSLGKSSSRESDIELPNICVRSFQNQGEGTGPKKPRLFDNVEDCWPLAENTPKTVHRKVIEPSLEIKDQIDEYKTEGSGPENDVERRHVENEDEKVNPEYEGDHSLNENYYDACEAFNGGAVTTSNDETESKDMANYQDETDDNEKNKKFLVTAIIPQDLDMKPAKPPEESVKEVEESKPETGNEKGKKFTCEFSIDFAAKVVKNQEQIDAPAIKDASAEEPQNQICNSFEVMPTDYQVKRDNSLLTFRKSNKCLEIQITQVDQKENACKSLLQQKMVVKFGKDCQADPNKTPKFQFNLALTSAGDKEKMSNFDEPKLSEEPVTDMEVSPRTVWNDAAEEIVDEIATIAEETIEDCLEGITRVETQSEITEEVGGKQTEDPSDMKLCQDSLRYEKNLEFLQQKAEEKFKDEEEEVTKDKPSAILIQNGPTKLALIRYQ